MSSPRSVDPVAGIRVEATHFEIDDKDVALFEVREGVSIDNAIEFATNAFTTIELILVDGAISGDVARACIHLLRAGLAANEAAWKGVCRELARHRHVTV